MTNVRSRVLPAVSIIFIGNSSLPPALISASFSCMSFFSCDPGVGGMKMHDFQKFPSQFLFFLLFSIQREDSLQPLGRYTGLTPSFSAFKIFPYPWRPDLRISARKGSLYPEFFRSCMKSFKCFLLVEHGSSLLQFNSLLINSCVSVVLFCPQGWADVDIKTFFAAIGLE